MLELTRMFDVGRAAAKTQERGADDDDVEYTANMDDSESCPFPKTLQKNRTRI